uniref:Uncharacterized protein n=1 Tax=Panagrolaimus davidi TaxID=227884 RepID=A0A914QY29_9BILA
MLMDCIITYLTIFMICGVLMSCVKPKSKRFSAGGGCDDVDDSKIKKPAKNKTRSKDKGTTKKQSTKAAVSSSKRTKTRPSSGKTKKINSAPAHASPRPMSWGNKISLKEHEKETKYTPPHALSISPQVLSFDSNGTGKILFMNCEDQFYFAILLQ